MADVYREKAGKVGYKVGRGKPPLHTRFKKGKSGNPDGARKHKQFSKLFKHTTEEEVIKIINTTLRSTSNELLQKLSSPDVTVAETIIGECILDAAKKGNWKVFNSMMNRVIGKVRDAPCSCHNH